MPTTTAIHHDGSSSSSTMNQVLERTQSQWLFTASELAKSPSILEGMPAAQELANRQKGVNFITQVGIMLKLPQLTLATAAVFLHRFYMRHPMQVSKDKGIHHYQVAATALFLATKVEENCRKMRELIVACCRVAQKQPNLMVDDHSKEFWKWRDTILHNEDVLLEALCFDLQLEQPYRILFELLCYYGVQDQKNLRNTSWAFLNDSHVTTLCLSFMPRTIAGSALYAGVRLSEVTLPDDEQGRPWWQHLELDIFDIQKACMVMVEVYKNSVLPRQGPKDAYLKEEDILSFDRTRRTQSPSVERSPTYSQRSTSQGVKREREDSWGHEQRAELTDSLDRSKDSADGQAPSPKRQRTNSFSNGERTKSSQIPSTEESRVASSSSKNADDLQKRIDDIVSASRTLPERRHHENRHQSGHDADQKGHHETTAGAQQTDTNGNNGHESPVRDDRINSQNENERAPRYVGPSAVGDEAEEVDYGSEEGEV